MSDAAINLIEPDTDDDPSSRKGLIRWGWVSLGAALLTLALKFGAYAVTGSVGLLSDAVESTANLIAAFTAILALWYTAQPVDRSHNYGHAKIEYFASAVEGGLILLAGVGIFWYAIPRFIDPRPIESLGIGSGLAIAAALINFGVARLLLRVGEENDSVVLRADGLHLMTDVWTSLSVVVGLALVHLTGFTRLDPFIAMLIALNVLRTGVHLLRQAFDGLMDKALPPEEEAVVRSSVQEALPVDATFHALRTRKAGPTRFVDFHVLLPGATTLHDAHDTALRIERNLEETMPRTEVTIHLEPLESPEAWTDSELILVEGPNFGFDLPDFLQPAPNANASRESNEKTRERPESGHSHAAKRGGRGK